MANPLDTLLKWASRYSIDESSDEAIDDNLTVSTEMVFMRGERLVLRRVFVRMKGHTAYSRVGWVVTADCPHCMVCSTPFADSEDMLHCCACGNIACARCGAECARVHELGQGFEEVRVCSLCYWGQDIVAAVLRATQPSLMFSPGLMSAQNKKTLNERQDGGGDPVSRPPLDSETDDSEDDDPRRVINLSRAKSSRQKVVLAPSHDSDELPLQGSQSVKGTAVDNTFNSCIGAVSLDKTENELVQSTLHGIAALATVDSFGKSTARVKLFKCVMCYMLDHTVQAANGVGDKESYPMMWIREQFMRPDRTCSPRNCWLPLHWCSALSGADSSIGATDLTDLLDEDPELSLSEGQVTDVSILSLAVAKPRPSLSFVEAITSRQKNATGLADKDGAYPLMYAAAWNDDSAILEKLYDLYPGAISRTDSFGFSPLLFACYAGNLATVKFLLKKYPKAISVRNNAGALPLHACAANTRYGGVDMARELIALDASAASRLDDEGSLPLHVAAQFGSFELIQYLYDIYPFGASQPNHEGLLPMHLAGLRKQKSVAVLNLLTEFSQQQDRID